MSEMKLVLPIPGERVGLRVEWSLSWKRTLGITQKWQTDFYSQKVKRSGDTIYQRREFSSHTTLLSWLDRPMGFHLNFQTQLKTCEFNLVKFFSKKKKIQVVILCRCFSIEVLFHFPRVCSPNLQLNASTDSVVLWGWTLWVYSTKERMNASSEMVGSKSLGWDIYGLTVFRCKEISHPFY